MTIGQFTLILQYLYCYWLKITERNQKLLNNNLLELNTGQYIKNSLPNE